MNTKFPVDVFTETLHNKGYRIDIKRPGGIGAVMAAKGFAGLELTITQYHNVVFLNSHSAFGHTTKTFHRDEFGQLPQYLYENF